MRRQVERLIEAAQLTNVQLQVAPYKAGAHPGLYGGFNYMRFLPHTLSDVVFVEGSLGLFLVDRVSDLERYRSIYDEVSRQHALTPPETLTWLKQSMHDWAP
jgi:hypothetical protein